ncbi:proteoglycan 4 [Ceratitis capitata]|uniref:proteoglycan 4 n=1 Tax=Ceratitis capitata TaxID=7213 RepID=UPI000329B567|nr:proteoglycan 4 [Ceratitis capitata]
MLLKCYSFKLLLLLLGAVVAPAVATPNFRHFCQNCEEEVWEEVPCPEITTTTSTTTTTTAPPTTPLPTTRRPYTTAYEYAKRTTTTKRPLVYRTTAAPPVAATTTPSSAYNKCYYECKVGCKEFCRKVTVNGASQKQITQITKTSHRVPNGQFNSEHVHQHRFVPDPQKLYAPPVLPPTKPASATHFDYPQEPATEPIRRYAQPNLAYKVQSAVPHAPIVHMPTQPLPVSYPQQLPNVYDEAKVTNIYPDALLKSSYSVDELTHLLQMENLSKNSATSYSQPAVYSTQGSVPLTPLAPTPIYHSPSPSHVGYLSPAPPSPAAPKSLGTSSTPEYKSPNACYKTDNYATSLVGSAEYQYDNYINKVTVESSELYSSLPVLSATAHASNHHQSSSPLHYHSAYSNPTDEYMNSSPYLTHYTSPVTGYDPLPQSYAGSY